MKKVFNEPIHNNNKTQFIEPSTEEVKKLFEIKGCYDQKQPLLFMAHYESNGWRVGKAKMRSWRAAVAGWVLRMEQFQSDKPAPIKHIDTSNKEDSIKLAEIEQIKRAYQNQRHGN